MPDHVHLLVEVDPQFGVHTLVKRIKGRSSRILRQEFRRAPDPAPRVHGELFSSWPRSAGRRSRLLNNISNSRRASDEAKQHTEFCLALPLGVSPGDERILSLGSRPHDGSTTPCSASASQAKAHARVPCLAEGPIAEGQKRRVATFRKLGKEYGFTSAALSSFGTGCKNAAGWKDRLGAHETQRIAERAFAAVEEYGFGKRGKPRFKGKNRPLHSVDPRPTPPAFDGNRNRLRRMERTLFLSPDSLLNFRRSVAARIFGAKTSSPNSLAGAERSQKMARPAFAGRAFAPKSGTDVRDRYRWTRYRPVDRRHCRRGVRRPCRLLSNGQTAVARSQKTATRPRPVPSSH